MTGTHTLTLGEDDLPLALSSEKIKSAPVEAALGKLNCSQAVHHNCSDVSPHAVHEDALLAQVAEVFRPQSLAAHSGEHLVDEDVKTEPVVASGQPAFHINDRYLARPISDDPCTRQGNPAAGSCEFSIGVSNLKKNPVCALL